MRSQRACWYCCLKHISTAYVVYEEILHGHKDCLHTSFLCGNLSCAEWHASEKWPELEVMIRGARKGYFEDGMPIPFEYLIGKLWEIAKREERAL